MDEAGIPDAPRTIAELPFFAGRRHPKPDLIGRCEAGRVVATSGRELVDQVRDLGLGLTALGMARGDRVAILAESRPEWLIADLAVLAAGGVTVPIYPTLSPEQVAFILRDSGAAFVVVSTGAQLAKVAAAAAGLPALRAAIVIDEAAPRPALPVELSTLAEVASRGHRTILDGWGVGRAFHDEARKAAPGDLATIIYTSGTTGDPKGVMLTHGNLVANIEGVRAVLDLGPGDVALSFLPLCHAFERMVAFVYLTSGVSMIFAESVDTVARDLTLVRPTVMTGVPRVFEKLHARILARGREAGGLRAALFGWAVGVAEAAGAARTGGPPLGLVGRLGAALAERLVFARIRAGTGGRLRFFVSGSAPLRADLGRFFFGVGLPILEGYGLTETAPVLTVMPLERPRLGSVGPALPNVELRLADDGEVLARGPNVMVGYYNRPDATAAVLRDGWLATGDIGAIGTDGYLRITDRKKELIATSGGKKIAPQPIEAALRAHPLVAEAVLVGEQRQFPAVLLVPDFPALAARLGEPPPGDAAAAASLTARDDARALYQAAIDELNARLAQFERIKRFALLAREFTLEAGELTPTLKVKRRVIDERYRAAIDALYA